ncbi:MAG: ECF-type riboflavin transporter substrate-binding protein [Bacilli bacterium]
MKKLSPEKAIVAIGIGSALFFVLKRFGSIPTPIPNTNLDLSYGVLGFFSILFGPVVGGVIGFIGHTLTDLTWGAPWFSWIIASAAFALVVGGLGKGLREPLVGNAFGNKQILQFNAIQVGANAITWLGVAPILDILIYKEPVMKAFAQGATAGVVNSVSVAIIGTLVLVAYSKSRPKNASLKVEK